MANRYPSPDQASVVRLINRTGALLARLGLRGRTLKTPALIEAACRETGLDDFGDGGFRPGLEHLVAALEAEAQLSTIGRLVTRKMLLGILAHRLRLLDYRKQHPEVARQEIRRPLIIMGLPRTGTTILFELLAQDPAHRSPASWELAAPVPPAREASYRSDARIARLDKEYHLFERLAPGMNAIHEMGAALPQECILIMGYQFMSEQFGASFNIPSYRNWYVAQDMVPTYRWHRQFLQHMQSGFARRRWLLKTPPHIGFLDALLTVYPDAALVQTHRDPLTVMPSLASLACTAHSGFSDAIDPLAVADFEAHHFAGMLQRGLDFRARLPDEGSRFHDVDFRDVLADPIRVIEGLYRHFGFELTPAAREAMVAYLAQRPREKHGVHRYSLEQFGLSREKHGALFRDYCRCFGL